MSRFNGIKAAQNAQIERKEEAVLQRLTLEADTEEIKVLDAQVKKRIAGLQLETTREGEKQALLGLHSARVQTSIAQIGLGKLEDKRIFEQADRRLSQEQMALNLTLKGVNINALREQLRHDEFLHGKAPVSPPKFQPVDVKLKMPFLGG